MHQSMFAKQETANYIDCILDSATNSYAREQAPSTTSKLASTSTITSVSMSMQFRRRHQRGHTRRCSRALSLGPLAVCRVGVTEAKMRTAQGQGKTLFFAYLSQVDKAEVLKLTGAPGADEQAESPHGKTAFFASLPGEVKYKGLMAWKEAREESLDDVANVSAAPTKEQLVKLGLLTAFPMVGFGFVDNGLMICCGDAIEGQFGRLGMSTMAAAGLGNLCSDVAGLGLADYIEHAAGKLGLPQPNLTREQQQLPVVRYVGAFGATMGISVGCLLGMFPLLFLNRDEKETKTSSRIE